jgi:hypothetical protein
MHSSVADCFRNLACFFLRFYLLKFRQCSGAVARYHAKPVVVVEKMTSIATKKVIALVENVSVSSSGRIPQSLLLLALPLRRGSNNNDGDRRVLKAVLGHGARKQSLEASERTPASAYHKDGRLVYADLTNHVQNLFLDG